MVRGLRAFPWIATVALCASAAAQAVEPCGETGWNLTHEQALFAGAPTAVEAGKSPTSAPTLATDRLYRLTLTLQQHVAFAKAPGKKALTDGAYAGIARFNVPSPGPYRVSIDRPFWIDVVQEGNLIKSTDFTGERGCAPHKIVAYDLPAGTLVLQLSGQVTPRVNVSITRAPASATTR